MPHIVQNLIRITFFLCNFMERKNIYFRCKLFTIPYKQSQNVQKIKEKLTVMNHDISNLW